MTTIKRQTITDAMGNPIGVILPIEEFALIEDLLMQRTHDVQEAQKRAQLNEAAHDPLFLADLHETMHAFAASDGDWWEKNE